MYFVALYVSLRIVRISVLEADESGNTRMLGILLTPEFLIWGKGSKS